MNQALLYRFFNGKTTLQEEIRIREWIEASPENKGKYFEERKTFDTMNLLVDENQWKGKKIYSFNRTWIKELVKIAAVITLTLTLSVSYRHFFPDESLLALQKIETPAGQRVSIELADGTLVWLNSRSQIQYPTVFSDDKRKIKLEGEAYFEVAHNEKKPFIVETSYGNIEVLGTKFNLEAYPESRSFVTSLFEGSVKVNRGKQQIILSPNQMSFLDNGSLKAAKITDFTPYRWREGLICFKDESFINIMKKFEKSYGVEIRIETSKVSNSYYSGKFRQYDGITNALKVLQKDVDFTFESDEENHIIHIK